MKVLVATRDTQGTVDGDYFCCVEGELVTAVAVQCCEPDRCGCGRGFPGLASSRATTTAMVVERPALTPHDIETALWDSLERDGWFDPMSDDERRELVAEHVEVFDLIASSFPDGTVVGRDGDHVRARTPLWRH